jgi:hypothetical protein
MNALGSTRINAMHNYFTYYDSVWKGLHISFERAVEKTIPKMKGAGYLEGAIKLLAKNHIKNNVKTSELFLRIFQPYFGYFYNEGKNNQFLNEVEKVFLLSLSWNKGNGSVNQNQPKEYLQNIAKRAIHTFNTHDYRYLAYAIKESQISHRQKILDFIKDNNVFIYCTNPSKK